MKFFLLLSLIFLSYSFSSALTSNQLIDIYKKKIKWSINTKEFQYILKKDPNIRVIDIRTTKNVIKQGGRIKVNRLTVIERGMLEFDIGDVVNVDEKFIVCGYDGKMSLLAVKALQDMGYKNPIHYKDGFKGWKKAGLEIRSPDLYPNSMLYSKIKQISPRVFVSIGELGPYTYENSGHNNNLGFVIGDKYVAVWNASSTYLLAKALHKEIKKITNKPVKYVVLENSQTHAVLGSSYWREQGAKIVSQEIAKEEIAERKDLMLRLATDRFSDKALGTRVVLPDITFKKNYTMNLGGIKVEAKWFGYAHERSDIILWIPDEKILFAGDLGFYQRLLPISQLTDVDSWLRGLVSIEKLKPEIVVPGHGDVTDIENINKYTRDYLIYLKSEVKKMIASDDEDKYKIDQSKFETFDVYELLSDKNAKKLFNIMEFDE